VIAAAGLGLLAIYSCSLIVQTPSQQCQMDVDCTGPFGGGAKCDTTNGVCVPGTGGSGTSTCVDAGSDPNIALLNACTTNSCTPFDNTTLKGIGPGGKLPDLPMPPPDGGM
jgi:hypothetical protein